MFRIEDTVFCIRCKKELYYYGPSDNHMEKVQYRSFPDDSGRKYGSISYHTHHCDEEVVLRFERKKKLDEIRRK